MPAKYLDISASCFSGSINGVIPLSIKKLLGRNGNLNGKGDPKKGDWASQAGRFIFLAISGQRLGGMAGPHKVRFLVLISDLFFNQRLFSLLLYSCFFKGKLSKTVTSFFSGDGTGLKELSENWKAFADKSRDCGGLQLW